MLQLFHLFLEQHVSNLNDFNLCPPPPEGRDRPRVPQSSSVDAEDQNKKTFVFQLSLILNRTWLELIFFYLLITNITNKTIRTF